MTDPSTPPPATSPPDSQTSQSSPVGLAVGAGVAVALLLVLIVLGGCLVLVWVRRKRTAKVVLQQHSNNLSNLVYDGEWGSVGKKNIPIDMTCYSLSIAAQQGAEE